MLRALRLPLLLVFCLAASCTPEAAPPEVADAAPAVRTFGDTTAVRIPGPLPDTLAARPVAQVRLPAPASEGDRAQLLAVADDGSVWVARSGELLRIGSEDSTAVTLAPEVELVDVSGLAALPGGRLVLRDEGLGEIILLEASGTVLGRAPSPGTRPVRGSNSLVVNADDPATLWAGIAPDFPEDGTGIAFPRPVWVRLDGSLQPVDTLELSGRYAEPCPTLPQEHFTAGRFEDIRIRYYPMVKWALGTTGSLVVGCPAEYTFDVHRPDGRVLRVSREWEPVEVPDQERFAYQTMWVMQMKASGRHEQWGWIGRPPPGRKPAYHAFVPAQDGAVWVAPARASVTQPAPETWKLAGLPDTLFLDPDEPTFDVFSADGSLRGHVTLPRGVVYDPLLDRVAPVIRGDTIWALRETTEGEAVLRLEADWAQRTKGAPQR